MKFHVSIIQFDIFLQLNNNTLNYLRYCVFWKIQEFFVKFEKKFCDVCKNLLKLFDVIINDI